MVEKKEYGKEMLFLDLVFVLYNRWKSFLIGIKSYISKYALKTIRNAHGLGGIEPTATVLNWQTKFVDLTVPHYFLTCTNNMENSFFYERYIL